MEINQNHRSIIITSLITLFFMSFCFTLFEKNKLTFVCFFLAISFISTFGTLNPIFFSIKSIEYYLDNSKYKNESVYPYVTIEHCYYNNMTYGADKDSNMRTFNDCIKNFFR